MLDNFLVIVFITTILGFLAGIGIGGGSLLILWLTLVLNMPQNEARFLNLIFFLPTALIATFFHIRKGRIEIKILLPAIVGGCIAATVGSFLSTILDVNVLKKIFGFLLLIVGIRELIYRNKKQAHS